MIKRCRFCGRRRGKGIGACVSVVFYKWDLRRGSFHIAEERGCGAIFWKTYKSNTRGATRNSTTTGRAVKSPAHQSS